MDVNKKSRAELKGYFVKNAVPTEGQFADLIDAALNQKDDGLVKPAGEPLSVEAAGAGRTAVRLYDLFTDPNPSWSLSLTDSSTTPATKGLTVTDSAGTRRLFINGTTGALSVGSIDTTGAVTAGGVITASAGLTVASGQNLTVSTLTTASNPGTITVAAGRTLSVNALTAGGVITANAGLTVAAGQSLTVSTLTTAASLGTITVAAGRTLSVNAVSAGGLINANAGLTVTGAALNVGTSLGDAQPLNVWGLLTANGGVSTGTLTVSTITHTSPTGTISVASGRSLSVNALTAGGPITASAGLTVPSPQPLNVFGTLVAPNRSTIGSINTRSAVRLLPSSNQHITLFSTSASFSSGLTLQAWIFPYSLVQFGTVIALGNSSPRNGDIILLTQNDGSFILQIVVGEASASIFAPAGTLIPNVWTHIAATVDANANTTLYRNGVPIATTLMQLPASTTRSSNLIGGTNVPGVHQRFDGLIAEVAIWTAARTPTTGPLIGNETGLIGYWKLNDIVGGVVLDSCTNTGKMGNGVPQNAPLVMSGTALNWDPMDQRVVVDQAVISNASVSGNITVPPASTLTASGAVTIAPNSRMAARFDKNSIHHISLPTIPSTVPFNTGYTVQAWVYAYSLDNFARIIDFGAGSQGVDSIVFYVMSSGAIGTLVVKGSVQSPFSQTGNNFLTTNTWTHVAVTVDANGAAKFYRNGAIVTTVAANAANVPNNVQRAFNYIARSNWSTDPYFNGFLAEVAVFTGERPITTSILNGNEPGLVGYWKLAGNAIDSCTNSPKIGNGTLAGSTFPTSNPIFMPVFDRALRPTIVQEDWINPTLQNNFIGLLSSFNPPGYFRDSQGIVHLRGVMRLPGVASIPHPGQVMFTLPPGYRPQWREVFPCFGTNGLGRIDVWGDGTVWADTIPGADFFCLDGIRFRAFQ